MDRGETDQGRLVRAGFSHPDRAVKLLDDSALCGIDRSWLIGHLSSVGDPHEGLLAFIRLCEAAASAGASAQRELQGILSDEHSARRLFAILGFSHPLTDHLIKDPGYVHIFNEEKVGSSPFCTSLESEKASALAAVHAHPVPVSADSFTTHQAPETIENPSAGPGSYTAGISSPEGAVVCQMVSDDTEAEGIDSMRAHYWYRIAQIAAEDLMSARSVEIMPEVSAAITDIVGGALESALAVGRGVIANAHKVGLAIIAMGKTGARELNYISDVDVVYVARSLDPQLSEAQMLEISQKLAAFVARAVSKPGGREKSLWELDANLRPEGKDGPLVRTLESHLAYYKRWAKDWEFQALLKARPIAGDMELGEQYCAAMHPMVWSAAGRENFVEDSRAMRERVENLMPAKEAPRQLKLGKGGLRDVEFTVQLLQLVHGRTDSSLRVRNTLEGITALTNGGYISRKDGEKLAADYKFLRTLEHRIQLQRFKRSHLVPQAGAELRRIARTMHGVAVQTETELEKLWQEVRHEVRELHLAIYYRPILPYMARLSESDVSLDPGAAKDRLAAIGYRDPAAAMNHISALTRGVSRTAAIQRQLLPVMIGWFTVGAEPDQGLKSFRLLSEQMGHTSWYMRLLRDSSAVAERLAYVLSASRFVAAELPKLPEAMSWLDDDILLEPRSAEELQRELESLLSRRSNPQDIAVAGRYLRRKELLRAALADVTLCPSLETISAAISRAGEIAVDAALRAALADCDGDIVVDIAVIGMGRFGGRELNYASDADVLFVYEAHNGADLVYAEQQAIDIAQKMMHLIAMPSDEPGFELDAGLRPEGKNGPLARSLSAYREYYERWADTWECQALLRARFICGDHELGERFIELIEDVRYPRSGLNDSSVREIRAMKARVERERMPRGVDPLRHLKLGKGSLSDVEWTVQLLQLQYAGTYSQLRSPATTDTLAAAAAVGIISSSDARKLIDAWATASHLRNLNVLATGRMRGEKVDILPCEADSRAVVAALAGYDSGAQQLLDEDYLRVTRRAREVVERVFYGINS